MKKAITILAVLIVLVGAVFANESHTIQIKADVSSVIPVFGLKYLTVVTNSTADANEDGVWDNNYSQAGTYNADATELDPALSLDKGGAVVFDAMLLNPAKQKQVYHLTFTDGRFTVTTGGGANTGVHVDPIITTGTYYSNNANPGVAAEEGDAAHIVDVTFNGLQVVNASGLTLAKATYTYQPVPTVDMPSGQENFYYANVTMTVSTN